MEPIIETIEKCRQMAECERKSFKDERRAQVEESQRRLDDMQEFFTAMNGLFNLVVKIGQRGIGVVTTALSKLGG